MRKHRRALFILLSLAAIGLLLWLIFPSGEPEPVYQGKPLHQWLALYSPGDDVSVAKANEAVRHIGTNAIPVLLEMLQDHDSPLKLKWIALLQKQDYIHPPQPAELRNDQAVRGLKALGPAASNAVPTLMQIYRRKISNSSQEQIFRVLIDIGPSAFPAATPAFLDALSSTNFILRRNAALAILNTRPQPDIFAPALVNALKDPDFMVKTFVIQDLAAYGPSARSAVPALFNLLNEPDSNLRTLATNALKSIDPVAASAAGIK